MEPDHKPKRGRPRKEVVEPTIKRPRGRPGSNAGVNADYGIKITEDTSKIMEMSRKFRFEEGERSSLANKGYLQKPAKSGHGGDEAKQIAADLFQGQDIDLSDYDNNLSAHKFFKALYQNPNIDLPTRIKAAEKAVQFETPKPIHPDTIAMRKAREEGKKGKKEREAKSAYEDIDAIGAGDGDEWEKCLPN